MTVLTIRREQMAVFRGQQEQAMEDRLAGHFLRHYPRESRQAGGREAMLGVVRRGIARGRTHGFAGERDLGLFTGVTIMLGAGFDLDPQLGWASELLADRSVGPADRIDYVFQTALDYLSATAGEDSEMIVRAMLRVRSWEPETAPKSVGEDWEQEMCLLFERLYPQKYAYQGEEATVAMLRASESWAAKYEIRGERERSIYALHAFMLGSGFDTDLLHPWAAQALTDATCATDRERVERLWAGAMRHIDESLSKD